MAGTGRGGHSAIVKVFFLVVLASIFVSASFGVSSSQSNPSQIDQLSTVTEEGTIFPFPKGYRQPDGSIERTLSNIRSKIESVGLEMPEYVAILVTPENDRVILITDRKPRVERGSITGYNISTEQGRALYVLPEQSSYNRNPKLVEFESLAETPGRYVGNLIQIKNTHVQEGSWEVEYQDTIRSALTATVLGERTQLNRSLLRSIRYQTKALGNRTNLFTTVNAFASGLTLNESTRVVGGFTPLRESWWHQGRGDVVGGVYSEEGIVMMANVSLYATDIRLSAESLRKHKGEIVSFSAKSVGGKLSTREALIAASSCPGEQIGSAAASGACVPALFDVTLHSGVLVSGNEVVSPYVGASNIPMDSLAASEIGTYEITGRVLNSSKIDPRLETPIVVQIYERERIGEASISSEATQSAQVVQELLQDQLTMESSEWSEIAGSQRNQEEGAQANNEDGGRSGGSDSGRQDQNQQSHPVDDGWLNPSVIFSVPPIIYTGFIGVVGLGSAGVLLGAAYWSHATDASLKISKRSFVGVLVIGGVGAFATLALINWLAAAGLLGATLFFSGWYFTIKLAFE